MARYGKWAAALGTAAAIFASSVAAQEAVSLRLNWYLGGLHVPFYYGKDLGFYKAEGIDLTINEGRGSGNTVQVVAAGSDTFGMADSGSLALAATKGAEVKAVMSLLNTAGFGVISRADAGIRTPKDLEGKRLAVTAGDALTQLFPAVVKANNLDMSKISLIQVDPAGKVVSVLEKRADALLGGIDDQFFLLEQRGVSASGLRFADHGAPIVGMTILARNDTIASKPDVVRRFVRATIKSWEEAKKNPGAAVDAALKVKPDLNRDSTLKQLMVDIDLLESKNTKGKTIGWGSSADWDETISILKQYRDLKTDQPATAFYTNEFIPN